MSTKVAVSNKTIVRRMFDAFKKGDIPFILDQLDENCQWSTMGAPHIPFAGLFVGKGASLFFSKMNEYITFETFDVEHIYEVSDNEVVSTGHFVCRGRQSGRKAESPFVMINRFRRGKVIYFQDYVDSAKLAAIL